MDGEYLYEAIGGISPLHVHEAEAVRFSRSPWRTIGSAAACLSAIAGMYLVLQAQMAGADPSELSPALSFVGPAVIPAAQRITEHFQSSPWFNWGSLLLALAAWGLPTVSLCRRGKRQVLTLASLIACTLSLLLQVCAVLHRVNNGDFTGLTRSMPIILPAALVIAAGTAVLNLAAYMKHRRRKK